MALQLVVPVYPTSQLNVQFGVPTLIVPVVQLNVTSHDQVPWFVGFVNHDVIFEP